MWSIRFRGKQWENGLVIVLLHPCFQCHFSLSRCLLGARRLSLTATVSLCCRWEREINNLSTEMWPSKYGPGLSFSHPLLCLWDIKIKSTEDILFFLQLHTRLMFFLFSHMLHPPFIILCFSSCWLLVSLKTCITQILVCSYVVLFGLFPVFTPMSSVTHRCGFRFKMWINLCTVGRSTASNQSYARSRWV